MNGFFEVFIIPKNSAPFSIKIKKEYIINQVKQIIQQEKGITNENYQLAFNRPLLDGNKTLESYGVTKTVRIWQISNSF